MTPWPHRELTRRRKHSRRTTQSHTPQQHSATPLQGSACLPPAICLSYQFQLSSALFCSRSTSTEHPRVRESCSVSGGKAMGARATSPPPWRRHCLCRALHFLVLLLWSVRTSCRFLWFFRSTRNFSSSIRWSCNILQGFPKIFRSRWSRGNGSQPVSANFIQNFKKLI